MAEPCACGKPVRLGAYKITINRKRGVAHYIVHKDGTPVCVAGDWATSMVKPYPTRDEDKDWFKMLGRWNDAVSITHQKGVEHG